MNKLPKMVQSNVELRKPSTKKSASMPHFSRVASNTNRIGSMEWLERQKEKEKQNQKVNNHRRVRSSLKISTSIKTMSTTFSSKKKQKSIGSKVTKTQETCEDSPILFINKYRGKNKECKIKDLLTIDELNLSKKIILEVEQERIWNKFPPNPKQWQYHNCLSLQKIPLYTTNLKISCEGWIALDKAQNKYLRGWKPKQQQDFSPLLRVFLAKMVSDIEIKYKVNLSQVLVRVNDKQLKKQTFKSLNPHTILSYQKLITGMLMTEEEDFLTYAVYNIGYLLTLLTHSIDLEPYVFLQHPTIGQLDQYCQRVENECSAICSELQLFSTVPSIQVHNFKIKSTPLDIAILFLKSYSIPIISTALNYRIYEPTVRYQVGWKFWQTRKLKWSNYEYNRYRLVGVGGKNKKNQCYVVYSKELDLIIAVADTKINMHLCDISRIENWVKNTIPRFNKKYCIKAMYFPTNSERIIHIQ